MPRNQQSFGVVLMYEGRVCSSVAKCMFLEGFFYRVRDGGSMPCSTYVCNMGKVCAGSCKAAYDRGVLMSYKYGERQLVPEGENTE